MSEEILKLKKEIERLRKAVKKQRYGLVWMDVPEAFENDVENKLPILKEVSELAIKNNDGKPTHILIEGDNYHALTCLNYTHKGKIDVIYIDPPYNTGSDGFRYKDKRILDKYPDGTEVPKDHPFRHSYWLSFMRKRLDLAKDLLKKEGLLMVSIDENELYQLKLLLDEIYKPENFLSNIKLKVKAAAGVGQESFLQDICEYVLVYAKDYHYVVNGSPIIREPITQETTKTYNKILVDFGKDNIVKNITGGIVGEIKVFNHTKFKIDQIPTTGRTMGIYYKNFERIFRTTNPQGGLMQRIMPQIPKTGLVSIEYIPSKGRNKGEKYRYYFFNGALIVWLKDTAIKDVENKEIGKLARNTNLWIENLHQGIATEGGVDFKNGKKPITLIKNLIKLYPKKKEAIILDFFAGSGTTGHAVMDLKSQSHF